MNQTSYWKLRFLQFFALFLAINLFACGLFRRTRRRSRRSARRAAKAAAYQAFMSNKSCADVVRLYKRVGGDRAKRKIARVRFHEELARCGKWGYFWKKEAHHGRGAGVAYIVHLEKKGYKMEQEFFRWLGNGSVWKWPSQYRNRRVASTYAMYDMHGAKNVLAWLQTKSNPTRYCSRFRAAEPQFASWVRQMYINFMVKNRCRGFVAKLRSQLLSRNLGARQQACRYLGDHGKPQDVSRLRTLARTDNSWYRPPGSRRRVWTSAVCRSAYGRIQLRFRR